MNDKIKKRKIAKIVFLTLILILMSCTKKEIKIDFKDLEIHTKSANLIITSISTKESKDFYEYSIRIPKVLSSNELNDSLKEFNTEINDYVNGIVNRLNDISTKEIKTKDKKPSLNINYEIYYGYKIYSIILIATQNINDIIITSYRSYYIREDGKYLYNIDDIINTNSAFPFFMSEIKNSLNDSLSFDFQQAIIYFENKNIIIKFPDYALNVDDDNKQNKFEFKEEKILKYIKKEYKEAK